MSNKTKESKKLERAAKIGIWMASKSSRNKTIADKICRAILEKATAVKPDDDFMRDEFIDSDLGFDPEELERFQRGEIT